MATVTYKGNTYTYQDGMQQDAVKQAILSGQLQPDATPQQAPQSAPQDEPGILSTIGAGWKRMGQNVLAASIQGDDSDLSRYQLRKAKQASTAYQQERSQLGTGAGFVADIGTYAPVVAAGIAAPELGAAAMGGLTTAEALSEQQEQGSRYDVGSAGLAGLESAAVDYGTAGLGNSFVKAAAPGIKRTAATVANAMGQPAVSNMNNMIATNVAAGKPWDEGLAEAGLVGAATGGVLHGGAKVGSKMFRGIPEALGIEPNKVSADAMKNEDDLFVNQGIRPKGDFAQMNKDYSLYQGQMAKDMDALNINDDAGIQSKASEMTKASMNGGNAASIQTVAKLFDETGMPTMPHMWDVDVEPGIAGGDKFNVGRDFFGLNPKQINTSGEAIGHTTESAFAGTRTKAREAGLTEATTNKAIQDSFFETRNRVQNAQDSNWGMVSQDLKQLPEGHPLRKDMTTLRDALDFVRRSTDDAFKTGDKPALDTLNDQSEIIYSLGKKLGYLDKFQNPLGKTVGYSPAQAIETARLAREVAHKGFPSVMHGTVDIHGTAGVPAAEQTGLNVLLSPLKAAKKLTLDEAKSALSRRRLAQQKAQGAAINRGLAEGDLGSVAQASEAGLNAEGIKTQPQGQEASQGAPEQPTASAQEQAAQPQPEAATGPQNASGEATGTRGTFEQNGETFTTEGPQAEPRGYDENHNYEQDVMGGLRENIANPKTGPEGSRTHAENKQFEKQVGDIVAKFSENRGLSTNEIYHHINEAGGLDNLRKRGLTTEQSVKNILDNARKAADEKAANIQKELDEQNAGKTKAEQMKNTEDRLKSEYKFSDETIAKAHADLKARYGEGEYSATDLWRQAERIHRGTEEPNSGVNDNVPEEPTMRQTENRLNEHVRELQKNVSKESGIKLAEHPEIKEFIAERVRPTYGKAGEEKGMTASTLRTAMRQLTKLAGKLEAQAVAPTAFKDYVNKDLGLLNNKDAQALITEMQKAFEAKAKPGLASPDLKRFITRANKLFATLKAAADARAGKKGSPNATERGKQEAIQAQRDKERFDKYAKGLREDIDAKVAEINKASKETADSVNKRIDEQDERINNIERSAKDRAAQEQADVEDIHNAAHNSMKGTTKTEFEAAVERLETNPPENLNGYSHKAKTFVETMKAAADGFRNYDNPKQAKVFEIEAEIYEKAWKRKEELGGQHKQLWISQSDIERLGEAMKDAGGRKGDTNVSWGNKYRKMRLALLGNGGDEMIKRYIKHSDTDIEQFIQEYRRNPKVKFDKAEDAQSFFNDQSVRQGKRKRIRPSGLASRLSRK